MTSMIRWCRPRPPFCRAPPTPPSCACARSGGKGIALTTDCNPRYCYLDPYQGAQIAVAEAARNLSCVGATPLAVTDCLNFASPEKPEGFWQFRRAVEGLADACEALGTPVISGNVSFYNETPEQAHLPHPHRRHDRPIAGCRQAGDDGVQERRGSQSGLSGAFSRRWAAANTCLSFMGERQAGRLSWTWTKNSSCKHSFVKQLHKVCCNQRTMFPTEGWPLHWPNVV